MSANLPDAARPSRPRLLRFVAAGAALTALLLLARFVVPSSAELPADARTDAVGTPEAPGGPARGPETALAPDAPTAGVRREEAGPAARGGLAGVVLDEASGNPVPGLRVRWSETAPRIGLIDGVEWTLVERVKDVKRRYDDLFLRPGRESISDGDGRFRLDGVATGTVHLVVLGPHHYQTEFASVSLDRDERRDDLVLKVRAGGRVVGRVTDEAGAPIEGAEVGLFYPLSPLSIFTLEAAGTRKVLAFTDRDGRYATDAVRPGSGYFVHVILPRRPHVTRKGIVVERGRDTRVDVRLTPGGVVSGRVAGPDGEPVVGAELRPIRLGSAWDMIWESDVGLYDGRTDEHGRYRIEGLPGGNHRLFVRADGYAPAYREVPGVADGRVVRRVDFELGRGAFLAGRVGDEDGTPIAGAFVRAGGGSLLAPAEPAARYSRSGRGAAFASFELPVATYDEMSPAQQSDLRRAVLEVVGLGRSGGEDDPADDLPRERVFDGEDYTYLIHRFVDTTDEEGRFRIEGLTTDEAFWIWVRSDGHGDLLLRGALPDTDDLEIVLPRPAGFSGIVLDRGTGEPVDRFRVEARNLVNFDRVDRTFEAADGQFAVGGLNPGLYRYTVEADGYERHFDGRLRLGPGETKAGEIVLLDAGARIEGVVLDATTDEPIAEARVVPGAEKGPYYRRILPRMFAAARTDEEGRFSLTGVGAGDRTLTASHPRYVRRSVELEQVRARERRTEVVIRLARGGAIAGRVVGPGERPLVGVDVIVQSRDRSVFRQAVTDPAGAFLVEGLAAGPYAVMRLDLDLSDGDVFAMRPRLMNGLRPVDAPVEDGQTTHVTLRVGDPDDGALVDGRVLEHERPIAGAFVTFVRVDGGAPGTGGLLADRTDADGRYEIPGVEAGTYVARIGGAPIGPSAVRIPVEVADRGRLTIDLRIPGAAIVGRVLTPAQLPLEGVAVAVEAERRRGTSGLLRFATSRTGADGRFRLGRLAAGRTSVSIRGGRFDGGVHAGR
ncbi:MAG: carboxypeptidase regulatory-like domain-containing protein, partial [Planctomycetota bacterium JB042]